MSTLLARRSSVLLVVVGLLASMVLVLGQAPRAEAAPQKGTVVGEITGTQGGTPNVRMRWFDKDWKFLGERKVNGGIYSLRLNPGTYHLQFVDQRPSYDVTKYAPADITVKLGTRTVQRNVRLKRGAAITGTVYAGGKPAAGAKVVAANTFEQSYPTKANSQGQFAIGGLPSSNYSVFTYDRTKTWVGKSLYVPKLKVGRAVNVPIRLTKKAGKLLVQLYVADGSRMRKRVAVTAVSKATGQFWTETAKNGSVTFSGLYPGGYRLVAPGTGIYLARTASIQNAKVRAGRSDLASSFTWTKRGAWVTGRVVDLEDPSFPLEGASVLLFNAAGDQVGSTTSLKDGTFEFAGQYVTDQGLTVVAQPGPYSPYLGKGTHYCKYGVADTAPFDIVTSRQSEVGDVLLPHLPADEQDGEQCWPSDEAA
ncbi:MAG: hypothetical protein F2667_06285 [Actinobacteria bacterium]|uniref:Unannotated protein n=1 Tax=freshwater metagenome TaxID=449393 RepID=A0A6J6Q525_9ZZZZ|nr:hypothetical protein [Actinomycetota bacterium]